MERPLESPWVDIASLPLPILWFGLLVGVLHRDAGKAFAIAVLPGAAGLFCIQRLDRSGNRLDQAAPVQ